MTWIQKPECVGQVPNGYRINRKPNKNKETKESLNEFTIS